MLCFRIWTPWIYSLWSHVNIHSSVVKMKCGQEGFWEDNIRLHLRPKNPNEILLRQINRESTITAPKLQWDAPIQIPSQSAPCKYPCLPELILTPQKLWELVRVRKWYNLNILSGRSWGRVGPSRAMGSRRHYLKLTPLWSLVVFSSIREVCVALGRMSVLLFINLNQPV